jgi:hypothetical protein
VLLIPVGMVVLSATTAVHIEEAGEQALGTARLLAEDLARSIERRTASPAVVDERVGGECRDRCVSAVRQRTGADEVVLLRVFRSPTLIRLVAERFKGTATPTTTASRDINNVPEYWKGALDGVAASLFPASRPRKWIEIIPEPVARPPSSSRLGAWVFISGGVSVAAGATALGFGIAARNTKNDIEGSVLFQRDYEAMASHLSDQALAANVLFAVAAVGALATIAFIIGGSSP